MAAPGAAGMVTPWMPRTTLSSVTRTSGSAAVRTNFSTANDVNGRRIGGIALGVVHRF